MVLCNAICASLVQPYATAESVGDCFRGVAVNRGDCSGSVGGEPIHLYPTFGQAPMIVTLVKTRRGYD